MCIGWAPNRYWPQQTKVIERNNWPCTQCTHIDCPRTLLWRLWENNFLLETCIPTAVFSPKIWISRAWPPLSQTKVMQRAQEMRLGGQGWCSAFHSVYSDIYRRFVIRGATELSLRLRVWSEVEKNGKIINSSTTWHCNLVKIESWPGRWWRKSNFHGREWAKSFQNQTRVVSEARGHRDPEHTSVPHGQCGVRELANEFKC